MPMVQANGIDIYYEVQGEGEPLVLIPYLAADQACYAFQIAEYAKHFTCFTVDLRGAGLCSKPEGDYTTELLADDVAAFMQAVGMGPAHVAGLSLGAATGMWLAAKHPERVASLSLHSAWDRSDPFLRTVVESWRVMAQALGSVTDMVIQGIFPWCFTPELYAARPEYIDSLAAFQAPTLITFGQHDMVTSTRFAGPLTAAIPGAEVVVFENCAHAPIYEDVDGFNQRTLAFLQHHSA